MYSMFKLVFHTDSKKDATVKRDKFELKNDGVRLIEFFFIIYFLYFDIDIE